MSLGAKATTSTDIIDGNPRVIMWCVPRSVSTAMTKCMSFVDGAEVWLEPYIIAKALTDIRKLYYPDGEPLSHELKGNEEVYAETVKNLNLGDDVSNYKLERLSPVELKKQFDSIPASTKFVFIKDMAFGMPPSRYQYLPDPSSGFQHFFLIRHPVKVYKSMRHQMLKALETIGPEELPPGMEMPDPETFHVIECAPPPDEGTQYVFKAIHELWSYVRENVDPNPVIVDIDELMNDPSTMLPLLFRALHIPYSDDNLTWDASDDVVLKWKSACPNVRDAPRYAMWFTNAFNSTCFKASSTTASLEGVTKDIKEVAEKEIPYYEEMYKLRITP